MSVSMTHLVPFLAASAVKATAILTIATVAAAMLRHASAAARHLVWQVAIVAVLALTIASLVVAPRWRIVPRIVPAIAAAPAPTIEHAPAVDASGVDASEDLGAARRAGPRAPITGRANAASDVPAPSTARTPPRWHWPSVSTATLLLACWLTGFAFIIGRFALGMGVARWYTWRAVPLDAARWASLNETMSFAVGLGHPVTLLRSARTTTPMTFGVLSPVVLLPADADTWTDDRRRAVLLHELAHVQRLDSLTNIVATVAFALYWFNPLLWVAVKRIRAEGERACDDWVLRAGMRASTYAEHLLDMVKTIGRESTPAAALPMAQRSTFEGRLLAILEPGMNRNGLRRAQVALGTCAIALIVLPLSAMSTPAASSTASPSGSPSASATESGVAQTSTISARRGAPAPSVPSTPLSTAAVAQAPVSRSAVDALLGVLGDADADVRLTAIRSLGQSGDPRAIDALSKSLRGDKDATVRKAAAWALGNLGDARGVPALADALARDADVDVRRTAAWAVGEIGDQSGVAPLTAGLEDNDAEVRRESVWGLGEIGSHSAAAPLAGLLHDNDVNVRQEAVWALGEIGAHESAGALTGVLADADPNVRDDAAWALGEIGARSAADALGNTLRSDKDAKVRETAAWALGEIGDETANASLAAAMKDEADGVRSTAAWALGETARRPAPPALVDALHDPSVDVRRNVAWALGQIEDPNSAAGLRGAMHDSDAQVKKEVLRALVRIGDPAAEDALSDMLKDPDPNVRKQAAAALGGHGGWDVDPRPRPRPRPRPQPRPFGW